MIEKLRVKELLAEMSGKRVLVVGDVMLDKYVVGIVERISPEAPVPVVHVQKEYSRPGGSANVALNVQSLGGNGLLSGIMGRDSAGDDMLALLTQKNISVDGMVISNDVTTIVKTRIIAERQQIVRVDRESFPDAISVMIPELCDELEEMISEVDGVVIEDYGKGCITQKVVNTIITIADKAGIPVGLDPKDNHDLDIPGITIATPNYKEACAAAGIRSEVLGDNPETDAHLFEVGKILQERWQCKLLVITLGAHGMYLLSGDKDPVVIPTRAREVFDVSGAGDTVIATAVLALAGGASYEEAASLANIAAGVVVAKLGTAPCFAAEIMENL
jgi:D-beta-D-heptose 7-phosphate kinase/D-beta-D-heptose 1-phosphate adenosyltransferase